MNPYGLSRRDNYNCKVGCCATKYAKFSGQPNPGIKARRKTARQRAEQEIQQTEVAIQESTKD